MFEVHRVVVIPLAAPDEAVRLEDAYDLPGESHFYKRYGHRARLRP